ncbi:MAG: hypothetical protein RLZZ135_1212 [Cyanobacteriota bacterium]|jgi:hypothetical protein
MSSLSRHWTIWCIHPSQNNGGYKSHSIGVAQQFIKNHFFGKNVNHSSIQSASLTEQHLQAELFSYFCGGHESAAADRQTVAKAGLCLRCYVSQPILNACRKLASLFGNGQNFTYQELLSLVLTDDGTTLVVPEKDTQEQLLLTAEGKTETSTYQFFSIEVLRSYDRTRQPNLSLENWVYLKIKQNRDIRAFLSDFGFNHLSDWALLNRANLSQQERLTDLDRNLIAAFHTVYRRDRRLQRSTGKCPDPNAKQLQEMLNYLEDRKIAGVHSYQQLLRLLKQVAEQLRNYDVWQARESLEIYYSDAEEYKLRPDLPHETIDEYDTERQEMLNFLTGQLRLVFSQSIKKVLRERIATLQKSRKYAPLIPNFISGLQLYYRQNLSLREIADRLDMTNWAQARRLLDPGALLSNIRALTVEQLLDRVLAEARQMKLTGNSPDPDYLQNITLQIETWVDREIFQAAAEEMCAGQNRSMTSLYARSILAVIDQTPNFALLPALHLCSNTKSASIPERG